MGEGHLGAAPPEFIAYRDRTRAFSSIAGFERLSFDLTSGPEPKHIPACQATSSLFETLGVAPLLGRPFAPQDEIIGAAKVAILSYNYWQNQYAEDPHVVGKLIRLNEQNYQIIGVMPRGFTFPSTEATPGEPPDLWTPLSFSARDMADWASSFDTSMIGRLRNGVSIAQANDDVKRVAADFQREHPDIYSGNIRLDATAERWAPDFAPKVRIMFPMLCCAVGFVLLIACANIANLLLARAATRRREISIRLALGAESSRIIRQVLTETAILSLLGGIVGCALAYGLLRLMGRLPIGEINLAAATVDGRVLIFNLLLCGFTCLLCGVMPAWTLRRADINIGLKQSARQVGGGRTVRRTARLFVLAEVASSVVLLIGASLLLRSFIRTVQVPLGFNPEHALLVRTTLNRQRYAAPDRRHATERAIETRLGALPGVAAVALTTHVPLADERQIGFVVDGRPADETHWADNALVDGNYFQVMGIRLLAGRTFSSLDTARSALSAVINETTARQYWRKENPIGKGFKWGGRHLIVIGVVADVHVEGLDKPTAPNIYNSVYQVESGATTSAVFILRTKNGIDPMRLAAPARNAIWSVDHGLPIIEFTTLHQVVSASLAIRKAMLAFVGAFALLAMTLSLIGIYGVLSQAVAQRTPEMGIRLALGAKPAAVLGLIMTDGLRLVMLGILVGTATGVIAAESISKLLFNTPALDPISFATGVILLLVIAILASYFPAHRASRIDPMIALRYE